MANRKLRGISGKDARETGIEFWGRREQEQRWRIIISPGDQGSLAGELWLSKYLKEV